MVSPPRIQIKGNTEASAYLKKYCFYLDVKNDVVARNLETRIKDLGGCVEVFLTKGVTHVVSDSGCGYRVAPHATTSLPTAHNSSTPTPKGAGSRRRADAMLERVQAQPTHTHAATRLPHLSNQPQLPVLSVQKALRFLDKVYQSVCKAVYSNSKILKGNYIKFESINKCHRPVFKEFPIWPEIIGDSDKGTTTLIVPSKNGTAKLPVRDPEQIIPPLRSGSKPKALPRMTRKAKPRLKEREEPLPAKQNGFCEICHADYDVLSEHELSPTHLNFVRNNSNFVSLDSLINTGADVEAFLNMNKNSVIPGPCERRSLRKCIKLQHDNEEKSKELQVICNGLPDQNGKNYSPRDRRRFSQHESKQQVSPALSTDSGHFLRSKRNSHEDPSPRHSPRVHNGTANLSLNSDLGDGKHVNGKVQESQTTHSSKCKQKMMRSIRWRRPSPESAPQPIDNRQYYKVVGVSTKLRSSGGFQPAPQKGSAPPEFCETRRKEEEPIVVKIRKVRRSQLSVLSDEAEQFMFPKKEDSSDTEDDLETASSGLERNSSDVLTSETNKRLARPTTLKEISSEDEISQDAMYSVKKIDRRGKRAASVRKVSLDVREPIKSFTSKKPKTTPRKWSETEKCEKSEPKLKCEKSEQKLRCEKSEQKLRCEKSEPELISEKSDPEATKCEKLDVDKCKESCLKWMEGKLRASEEVERLEFGFESVPHSEPWFHTFKGQDDDKAALKNITQCFAHYIKSPKLPYELGQLPPLKPNCCPLSDMLKKPIECKPVSAGTNAARAYGTRGSKKKRMRLQQLKAQERRPRKSPREHASTLAILGSLKGPGDTASGADDDVSSETNTPTHIPIQTDTPDRLRDIQLLLSSVYDDAAEYDVSLEGMDAHLEIEKSSSKPDVLNLLREYDKSSVLDEAIRSLACGQTSHKTKRKGHKIKKKNKTGWPKKKKCLVKRELVVDEFCTDNTETEEVKDRRISGSTDDSENDTSLSVLRVKIEPVCRTNENSINSIGDLEDKRVEEEICWDPRLQPVVRVTKIDSLASLGRRLRSSAPDSSSR